MSDDGKVLLDIDDGVATITFDRPKLHNALSAPMYEQMHQQLLTVESSESVRLLLLRGAGGKSFVSGSDIRQFLEFEELSDYLAYNDRLDQAFDVLNRLQVPTIAVCRGLVVGGGLAIAVTCDLRICADDARFAVPVARTLGNMPSMAFLTRLAVLVGPSRMKELLFTAEFWDARQALDKGLVSEVYSDDDLEGRVEALCERLLQCAPLTLAGVKEAARRVVDPLIPAGEDLVQRAYMSEDFREGVASFIGKRKPTFHGR